MRQYKTEIRTKLIDFLLVELNARAEELGIESIVNVETGITAVPGATAANPSLFLYVGGRELSQSFFDSYAVQIGICFGCATPQDGERIADLWEDAIEDIFRTDRSLGDAALTWTGEPTVKSEGEANLWITICEFNVEYDIGGGKYNDEEEQHEELEMSALLEDVQDDIADLSELPSGDDD